MKNTTTQKTIKLYWQHAWKYPVNVIMILIIVPLSVLFNQFLSNLILSNVLNRLSHDDFQAHHLWASFGIDLLLYSGCLVLGSLGWRAVDHFHWPLEAKVERDIVRRINKQLLVQSADFHANRFGGSLVSQSSKFLGSYIRITDTTILAVLPLLSSLVWTAVILIPRAPLFVGLFLTFYGDGLVC